MSKIIDSLILSKSEVIDYLDLEKKPVIFWDTCALLDIIRLPLPERNHTIDALEQIIEIKNKIVSKDVISLSSELCITEFNDHIDSWIQKLNTESKAISKRFNNFIGFINKSNIGIAPIADIDISTYGLEDLLCQIIFAITKETIFVGQDSSFASFAHFRTTNKIPPAKKKGEYKDCYIWGTCLEIRKMCSDRSYSYNFLSSNTSDYAKADKTSFVTEIDNESTINRITYFPNFKIAYGLLRRDGII
ncbi:MULTISPECIES: PIN domain-containing protein [unclassified Chryseobacterium]|uniref:PIN domain-containing protein n=1 Tax=unclassified Chryseobacterium TaxID=2593645 RepID=UPI000956F7A9|nr:MULTISPECIES: PIN domain-containing protein [unclassified Chryseobacterium]SIR48193.1 hypothetical protein SAMN05880573_12414 [Chryseobacterium sp. RU33C]